MKKIDLHIHTVPSSQDVSFVFDMKKFQEYIDYHSIGVAAITNHNLFDLVQFQEIVSKLKNVTLFPGIEIDLEGGHLLLISENNNLEDFSTKCNSIQDTFQKNGKITTKELETIFVDLANYLLIPHYDKKPKVSQSVIGALGSNIFTGEVSSAKKFSRLLKDPGSLTPVSFSDCRISTNLNIESLEGSHTFINSGSDVVTIDVLKSILRDKNKVFLSDTGDHGLFEVFTNGQNLSTGLNVILGSRSSGKSFFLKRLKDNFENRNDKSIKYIEQFELVKESEKEFNERVKNEKSIVKEEFLKEFKDVVEDVSTIDRKATIYEIDKYINSLLDFASSEKLQDEFSKAVLFKETPYQIRSLPEQELQELVQSVAIIVGNTSHKSTIEKHLPLRKITDLFNDLSNQYKECLEIRLKKEWVNSLIGETRKALENRTASPTISDSNIDFYKIKLEKERIKKFNGIVTSLKKERDIKETEEFGKFKIRAVASPYLGAQGLHEESGKQISFSESFKDYDNPIKFLESLKLKSRLEKTQLYRYFCKITYHVLNEYDKGVSGGEMAEFNLLRILQDARQYDMLLIDEPESSFDNVFLKESVNKDIKDISKEMPVVVVTHNNTVGMLMEPDYVLYTQRKIDNGVDQYKIFSGCPGDKVFKTADGSESIESYETLMNALEAGQDAYNTRKAIYDNFKK